ncbi:MAG: hypothetical protein WCG42_06505 [Parachlamydiaceae bacterium]
MKYFIFLFLVFTTLSEVNAEDEYSIVFVHIGNTLPPYTKTALSQARLFNPTCPIILLASEKSLDAFENTNAEINITQITCESLTTTLAHKEFNAKKKMKGFWRTTSERFLYLNDLMTQYNLTNVFHLENDNMLYTNVGSLLPIIQEHYKGMAAPFANDNRCIPSFVYIPDQQIIDRLSWCFVKHFSKGYNDMDILAIFKNEDGIDSMDLFPTVTKKYVTENKLISPVGHKAKNNNQFCQYADLFESIFDAAAIGQYLGGSSPESGGVPPGFINESSVYNPSLFTYEWILDEEHRKIPYACYGGLKFRINNLHIHSKQLDKYSSTP